jgi:hypothetical protein
MNLDRLLQDNPQLHTWRDGTSTSWAISPDVLRAFSDRLQPGMKTLETGSGHSTVVFAIAGTDHTCITPSEDEAEAIRRYCDEIGVTTPIRFVLEPSDIALPRDDVANEPLDFVLIDGAHRYPLACVDFHYTGSRVKLGGFLAVDDCAMASVRILHDFLFEEPEWRRVALIGDTAIFERIAETPSGSDWELQRMNQGYRMRKRVRGFLYAFAQRFR